VLALILFPAVDISAVAIATKPEALHTARNIVATAISATRCSKKRAVIVELEHIAGGSHFPLTIAESAAGAG
jgi:hypothetical protein